MAQALLLEMGHSGALLALLACGHACADFVVQSDRMVQRKRERRSALWQHAALVALTHAAFLSLFGWRFAVLGAAALGLVHAGIDAVKIALDRRGRAPGRVFLLDQATHGLSLLLFWALLNQDADEHWLAPPAAPPAVTQAACLVAALAVNGKGAAFLVSRLLARGRLQDPGAMGPRGLGALIGMLERGLMLLLISGGQWGAVGFVLAAKSVARFKDLENRAFSECYLVGTLGSSLCAVSSGLLLRMLAFD